MLCGRQEGVFCRFLLCSIHSTFQKWQHLSNLLLFGAVTNSPALTFSHQCFCCCLLCIYRDLCLIHTQEQKCFFIKSAFVQLLEDNTNCFSLQSINFPAISHPCQHLAFLVFFKFSDCIGIYCYLIIDFIFILVTNDIRSAKLSRSHLLLKFPNDVIF